MESIQPDFHFSRRRVLAYSLLPIACAALGRSIALGDARAQSPTDRIPELSQADSYFLALSRAITGHSDLNPTTAMRLSAAFARVQPAQLAQLHNVQTFMHDGQDAAALLQAAETAGLGTATLALVTAWYTGTVDGDSKTEVVSYTEALMYQSVRDAMAAPTYCLGGPAWWTELPPAVGVSPPVHPTTSAPANATPDSKPK